MYALFTTLIAAALASSPPSPSAGDLAFQGGDFDAAFVAYNAALTASPDDADANLGLGTIDLYRNDLKNAVTYLGRAVQLDPQNTRARLRLHAVKSMGANTSDFQIDMRGAGVAVPFIAVDPQPLVRATVNGHPLTLALDTNAAAVELSPDTADRLKVSTAAPGGVKLDTFATPGLRIRNVWATVADRPMIAGGRRIDGAIGTAFLYHFLSTIDYAQNRLLLRARDPSRALETAATKSGGTVVPMWLVGDRFIFTRARVNGGAAALFNIDTAGAAAVQLTQATLDAAAIAPDATQAFVAQNVALGNFAEANVAGIVLSGNERYSVFPFAVGGTISRGFFRGTQMTFDFDAMKLIVSR